MSSSMSILILPPLPSPVTAASIQAAYGDSIYTALARTNSILRESSDFESWRLDVALATSTAQAPKADRFDHWQSVVALLYEVVCAKAAEGCVVLDTDGGIDVRIFIVDTFVNTHHESTEAGILANVKQGPIIDLPTLALSARKFVPVYSVESESGERVLQKYLGLLKSQDGLKVQRVPGGPILKQSKPGGPGMLNAHPKDMGHKSVAVGGTFDHLHAGHKLLLFGTALSAKVSGKRMITIGITGDELLKNKKFADVMESWETRQERVADFIESILLFSPSISSPRVEHGNAPSPNGRFVKHIFSNELIINYVQISDPFGPTITDEDITGLVISAETRAGGAAVNKKRSEQGWKELDVLEISVLDSHQAQAASESLSDQEFNKKISSTEIRKRIAQSAR